MAKFQISVKNKKIIRTASKDFIAASLIRVRPKWIHTSNRYRKEVVSRYETDSHTAATNSRQLIEYIAASAPAHVIDGWSLLGRAIDSTLRGDTYASVHFGYYAELRAAMSLLASEGIGIFDRKHPIVDAKGNIQDISGGTHKLVGPCLRFWATLQKAGDLLDTIIQPHGISLSNWLVNCGAHSPTRAIGRKWLREWGIDLNNFEDDRKSRNLASYRPSEFRLPNPCNLEYSLTFIKELWSLFEPAPNGKFKHLERLLLRRALSMAGLKNIPYQTIEKLGFSLQLAQELANFLNQSTYPLPLIISDKTTSIEDSKCHLQVIARASLLLYIATSASAALLRSAGYASNDLTSWWQRFGLRRGLWEMEPIPSSPIDIWADVKASLDDLEIWLDENKGKEDICLRTFRTGRPILFNDLGLCEIIAIWGIAA